VLPDLELGVNPVLRTYVRSFWALPYREVGTSTLFQPCWTGDVSFYHDGVGTGFIPRAYPDPTNKKNLDAFFGRVLKPPTAYASWSRRIGAYARGDLSFDLPVR